MNNCISIKPITVELVLWKGIGWFASTLRANYRK